MPDQHGFTALSTAFAQAERTAAIYVGADGRIRSWNVGAKVLFGHFPHDAIGKRADLIVPDTFRDAHWSGFNKAVRSGWRGSTEWSPIEALHKNGQLVAVEVFLLPLEQSGDALQGVLAIFRQRSASIAKY
jgi:PAS domain S-box-containing protein